MDKKTCSARFANSIKRVFIWKTKTQFISSTRN